MSLYFVHVFYNCRKVAIGYNGTPHIRPKLPFSFPDPQTALPASFLDPPDLPSQTASRSDPATWPGERSSSPSGYGWIPAAKRILTHFRPNFFEYLMQLIDTLSHNTCSVREDTLCPPSLNKSSFARSNSSVVHYRILSLSASATFREATTCIRTDPQSEHVWCACSND